MSGQEARKHKRSPAYLGATIYFDDKPSTFNCLVRNVSDNGVGLDIAATWLIPDNFQLYIPKHDNYYVCQTKWKAHNKLGAGFYTKARSLEKTKLPMAS